MAKATHSQEIITGTPESFTDHELSDPNPPVTITRAVLGGELQSVGTDSSEPSNVETQSDKSENPDPQSPAQTTENPSGQSGKEESDSTAHTTGGSGRRTTQPRSGKRAAPTRKAAVRTIPDDDDF